MAPVRHQTIIMKAIGDIASITSVEKYRIYHFSLTTFYLKLLFVISQSFGPGGMKLNNRAAWFH